MYFCVNLTISTVHSTSMHPQGVVMDATSDTAVSYGQRFYAIPKQMKSYFYPSTFERFVSLGMDVNMGCMAHRITECSKCESIQPSICSYNIQKIMRQRFCQAHMPSIDNKDQSGGVIFYHGAGLTTFI